MTIGRMKVSQEQKKNHIPLKYQNIYKFYLPNSVAKRKLLRRREYWKCNVHFMFDKQFKCNQR